MAGFRNIFCGFKYALNFMVTPFIVFKCENLCSSDSAMFLYSLIKLICVFFFQPISDSSTYSTPLSWVEQNGAQIGAECTICYEHPIDAVLYMCGHMCMCYECALQQWRGKGGGHCPLCRAVIRDVIRTYKS